VAGRSLARVAGDLVGYVMGFQQAPEARRLSVAGLRQEVLGLLEGIRRDPAARAVPPADIEEACFALVAWVDETVLRTPWAGHDEWLREPLQLQLYRTNKAGDEFYEHLERLRPEQSAAREIYFLCLALGFEGQYAGHDGDRRALMARHYEMLRATGAAIEPGGREPLLPPAYELRIELGPGRRRRVWPTLLAIATGALALFGALWVLLQTLAEGIPAPPAS